MKVRGYLVVHLSTGTDVSGAYDGTKTKTKPAATALLDDMVADPDAWFALDGDRGVIWFRASDVIAIETVVAP